MVHVEVHHKVKDYPTWKEVFEEQSKVRRDSGSRGARIFRDEKDPNNIAIHFEWDEIGKARTFFESGFMLHSAERAGVIGNPEVLFEVEKTDA